MVHLPSILWRISYRQRYILSRCKTLHMDYSLSSPVRIGIISLLLAVMLILCAAICRIICYAFNRDSMLGHGQKHKTGMYCSRMVPIWAVNKLCNPLKGERGSGQALLLHFPQSKFWPKWLEELLHVIRKKGGGPQMILFRVTFMDAYYCTKVDNYFPVPGC